MKRLTVILLLCTLSAIFFNGGETLAVTSNETDSTNTVQRCLTTPDDTDIEELSDRLRDCSFELPNNSNVQPTRQGEKNQTRHIGSSSRSTGCTATLSKQLHTPQSVNHSKDEVAASRHTRGYYIYALRHIII